MNSDPTTWTCQQRIAAGHTIRYGMNTDVLPAVIDTEGVDALRLADQFERTIGRLVDAPRDRISHARWMRLVEAADRFAAHAGVQVA